MKKSYVLAALLAATAATVPVTVEANVYASELSVVPNGPNHDISFRLNQDADAVTVEIVSSLNTVVRTINAGALAKGARTVQWDGNNDIAAAVPSDTYTFRVTASQTTGAADWTKLSDDASAQTQYYSPRGLAINKNQDSSRFGRIYIADNAGQVAGGRLTGVAGTNDGVWALSADLTDITAQGNSAYGGGVAWPVSTAGPYGLALSDDGFLYVSDWTDPTAGIHVFQESNLAAAATELFGPEARAGSGARNNGVADYHGSINSLRVFGTGAGKYMLTTDEDITVNGAGPGSILRYDIGNAVSNYNTTPTVVFDDTANGNLLVNTELGFSFDGPGSTGNIWISQYRATDSAAIPSLIRYNTTSNTVDFNSGTPTAPGPFNATSRTKSDINPAKTRLALHSNATLVVLNLTAFPPTIEKTIGAAEGYGGATVYGVSWDAAGNLYSVSSSSERLRVFTPPGANSFTTSSPTGASIIIGTDVTDWNAYN